MAEFCKKEMSLQKAALQESDSDKDKDMPLNWIGFKFELILSAFWAGVSCLKKNLQNLKTLITWVTWPECPKDDVKRPEGPPTRSLDPTIFLDDIASLLICRAFLPACWASPVCKVCSRYCSVLPFQGVLNIRILEYIGIFSYMNICLYHTRITFWTNIFRCFFVISRAFRKYLVCML